MRFKTEVCERVSDSVSQIERRAQDLVERVEDAREALSGWRAKARRIARRNPGAVIAGAFALGFGLGTLARRWGREGQ